MKKIKIFFVAAALMLVTIGVFAGKSRFFSDSCLYYYDGVAHFNAIATGAISLAPGFRVSTLPDNAISVCIPDFSPGASDLYTYVPGAGYEFVVD